MSQFVRKFAARLKKILDCAKGKIYDYCQNIK